MSEFVIETGIEIPSGQGKGGRAIKYPWPLMKIMQSVLFMPENGVTVEKLQNRLLNSTRTWAKANNAKFATRQMDGGVRVCRTE